MPGTNNRLAFLESPVLPDAASGDALGKRLQAELPALAVQWQRRLEIQKNNISIFVPVEQRRQGLLELLQLLSQGLLTGVMAPFRTKVTGIARLRAAQGFNLRDSLEETLVLEDLLFQWACEATHREKAEILDCVTVVHKVGHTVLEDIARVYVDSMDRNLRRHQQASYTDGLTHLFNHRFFKEFLRKEIYRSQRYQHQTSLVLIDVDNFKKLNDQYGHTGGDQILIELARVAQSNCRITDLVCRYGGEEFAIVLPETPKAQATLYCERLRGMVQRHAFHLRRLDEEAHATISIGLSCYPEDAHEAGDLIHKADQAMYNAKHNGRNRVCFYAENGALRTA